MHPIRTFFSELYAAVFDPSVQKKIENTILLLAGIGFIIHLSLIFLKAQGVLLISSQYPEYSTILSLPYTLLFR